MSGMPSEVVMTPERHRLAQETSRLRVEIDMIDEWCTALRPRYLSAPGSMEINGIEYFVQLTEGKLFGSDEVRLEMVIPSNYPGEIPRIYIPNMSPSDFDKNAHMYRDSREDIHMCIMFPEDWIEDYSIAGMMIRSTIWLNKYYLYTQTGEWPGKGQAHCSRCGERVCRC